MSKSTCPTCGGAKGAPRLILVPEAKGEAFCRDTYHPCNRAVERRSK